MKFELSLGIKDISNKHHIVERTAIRGVIKNNDKLLMVLTNKGDYKFPGGGIKPNEIIKETLAREVMEETGFKITKIGDTIGKVIEKNIDMYDENSLFVMTSLYIECEIDPSCQKDLFLDDYEKEQDFKPVFINIEEALNNNLELINKGNDLNFWVYRETEVLKSLVDLKY